MARKYLADWRRITSEIFNLFESFEHSREES
jgi:hypothetical protein